MSNQPRVAVLLIHGAWSTPTCFNYLSEKIENCSNVQLFSYNIQQETQSSIIARLQTLLDNNNKNNIKTVVVGHSLGGLFALAVEDHPAVKSCIVIASPLNGIDSGRLIDLFLIYKAPALNMIMCSKTLVKLIQSKQYSKPIDIVVSTGGSTPLIDSKNDGVIPTQSQDEWIPITACLNYINSSHHEILQTVQLTKIVNKVLTLK